MAFRENLSPEGVEQYIKCAAGYLSEPVPSKCRDCTRRKVIAYEVSRLAFEHHIHFDDVEPHFDSVFAQCEGPYHDDTVHVCGEEEDPGELKKQIRCGLPAEAPEATARRITDLAGNHL